MCFWKSKQSKVLRAKRDIKVYKIGVYAESNYFYPFFYQAFEYPVNQIVFTKVKFTDTVYLGEFIIPKGATYCLNRYGEVVSDKLMYTGNHIEITSDKIYNSKELWKER